MNQDGLNIPKVCSIDLVELVAHSERDLWDGGVFWVLPSTLALIESSAFDSTIDGLQDIIVNQSKSGSGVENAGISRTLHGPAVQGIGSRRNLPESLGAETILGAVNPVVILLTCRLGCS